MITRLFSIRKRKTILLLASLFVCSAFYSLAQRSDSQRPGSSQRFGYTGAVQTFIVPVGVTQLQVDAVGASGGYAFRDQHTQGQPGLGGRVQANLSVASGQVLYIYVGGAGANGTVAAAGAGGYNGGAKGGIQQSKYSGGGGGGSTDIRLQKESLKERVIVAAGGGACGRFGAGGHGGSLTGASAQGEGENATGGTQKRGGLSGNYYSTNFAQNGGFGIGGSNSAGPTGGGGGGGWYGGGGGAFGDGGGGSSYTSSLATSVVHTQGYQTGNGSVTISWKANAPVAAQSPVNTSQTELKIYPNPTAGDFYMQLQNASPGQAELTLRLSTDAVILKKRFTLKNSNALLKYTVPGKVPGTYIITVETATGKQSGKIIVE